MPRRSAASLAVSPPRVDGRRGRLPAPDDLGEAQRAVWRLIVRSASAGHFRESDVPLLRSFCQSTVLADRAAVELQGGPVTAQGKVSPWLAVLEKAHRSQAVLAVRLRLCPSSRADPKTVARGDTRGASAYESYWREDADR